MKNRSDNVFQTGMRRWAVSEHREGENVFKGQAGLLASFAVNCICARKWVLVLRKLYRVDPQTPSVNLTFIFIKLKNSQTYFRNILVWTLQDFWKYVWSLFNIMHVKSEDYFMQKIGIFQENDFPIKSGRLADILLQLSCNSF